LISVDNPSTKGYLHCGSRMMICNRPVTCGVTVEWLTATPPGRTAVSDGHAHLKPKPDRHPRRTGRIEKITQAAPLLLYRENDWTLLPSHNVTSDYRE
jgi:hypothetical protein